MTSLAPNPEQLAAIEESGVVFVSAGAGTGKTTVLVERFVRAVVERGLTIESLLVITYTDRAAGELRSRIRARLLELDRPELARDIDRAWISTIHGFCSRVLRNHPFSAGLDPRFRVLDDSQARVLRSEAFTRALERFCASRDERRLGLLATYGAERLRSMLTGVFERLRSAGQPLALATELEPPALAALLPALAAACEEALASPLDEGERSAVARLAEIAAADLAADELLDPGELWPRGLARRSALAGVGEALDALAAAALEHVAADDRELLEALLVEFDLAYAEAKDHESAVDFEDLQLRARELLRSDERARADLAWRFRSVMVDEFQDTNRLQCELIDLLEVEELFFVGDEFQSIYRFRHADVDVFRERRGQATGVLALTRNYRSRPEVIDVVNHVFRSEFGGSFEPLRAAGTFDDPAFGPAVEVLLTDRAAFRDGAVHWRDAEARHVAARLRELVADGVCTPSEIVILFEASTASEAYERALREQGLPTYRATGRGYYGQQQVVDLLAYLRLLQNRYDDEALATVLASPLVGVSNDALVLLRRAAGRRPLFCGLEREPPQGLDETDRRRFLAFRQRYERLVRASSTLGLEALCEQVLVEHDYDLAVLARWDGRRRYANLRKLARLARAYEDLRGCDLEGFIRFVRGLDAVGAREGEAVAEEEGADAIRMLTIHAAKGLEFPVVVVADCGRVGGRAAPDEILCLPDGRFGFRVAHPLTGRRLDAPGYERVREAEREAERAEARRLYYVAMTRAIDRLILAGSLDLARGERGDAPIGWLLDRLGADADALGETAELAADGSPVLVRLNRAGRESALPAAGGPAEQLVLFDAAGDLATEPAGGSARPGRAALELPPLAELPQPPAYQVRRLSYSAIALFERCSYRFWAERFAGFSPVARTATTGGDGAAGLVATEIGDAVHVLLETGRRGAQADTWLAERYAAASGDDVARIHDLLAAWDRSPLALELAAGPELRPELAFAFEHEGVLVHGRFDAFRLADGRALVVDYKTNRLAGADPKLVLDEEYTVQVLVYALAAFRAGASEVEVAYAFLERLDAPARRRFGAGDLSGLEARLTELIGRIDAGPYRPTPGELVCSECALLDVVCPGPRLAGGPEWSDERDWGSEPEWGPGAEAG